MSQRDKNFADIKTNAREIIAKIFDLEVATIRYELKFTDLEAAELDHAMQMLLVNINILEDELKNIAARPAKEPAA